MINLYPTLISTPNSLPERDSASACCLRSEKDMITYTEQDSPFLGDSPRQNSAQFYANGGASSSAVSLELGNGDVLELER